MVVWTIIKNFLMKRKQKNEHKETNKETTPHVNADVKNNQKIDVKEIEKDKNDKTNTC